MDGEIKLRERLSETIAIIAERQRQIEQFHLQYEDAKRNEILNKFGVMEHSQLTVHVIQAEDVRAIHTEGGSVVEPYVLLTIEGQRIGTTPCIGNPTSPTWDERFTFDIINGQEPFQVMLANRDIYGSDDILGQA